MEHDRILGLILDLGVEMIRSGAETHRVEDSLYRLAAAYDFERCNIWVIPSNIQATVTAPDGATVTQIRHIRRAGVDFGRLDELNALSRSVCASPVKADDFAARLAEISRYPALTGWGGYAAAALAGAGFGVFFNCDPCDALVAGCTSLLVVFLSRKIGVHENNPLIVNFIISCVAEVFILLSVRAGAGHHAGYIAAGVVMLLISALGTTNGVRDLVHQDTLSGVLNIILSLVGAAGIALGVALPLKLLGSAGRGEIMTLNPKIWLQLVAAAVGCCGFAFSLNIKRKHVLWCVCGAVLTWCAYLLVQRTGAGGFYSALGGAVFCSLFAQIASRVKKAPATVFQTIAIFPVIPGAALYYTMHGAVMNDWTFALSKGTDLAATCFGIVLGFMLVEVLTRLVWPAPPLPHHSGAIKGEETCR